MDQHPEFLPPIPEAANSQNQYPIKLIEFDDIIESIQSKTGLSKTQIQEIVEKAFLEIRNRLIDGKHTKLPHFGAFISIDGRLMFSPDYLFKRRLAAKVRGSNGQ